MNLRKDQLYVFKYLTLTLLCVSLLKIVTGALMRCWLRLACGLALMLIVHCSLVVFQKIDTEITLQLLAMDVSAQATMKDAAKCDKRCEWQNSANQENVERILHF